MTTRIFTRRDGSKVEVDVNVYMDVLVEHIARTMAQHGKTKTKLCGGGITAVLRDVNDPC